MSRRLVQIAVVLVVLFAAAQLVRPDRSNPPVDASRTIQAHADTSPELAALLQRSCGDCHSNATVWPSYSAVAPVSWILAAGVKEGRNAVNFSEWSGYSADAQQTLLDASCRDVSAGKMPDRIWTILHPETRLSATDVEIVCAAARQAEAAAGRTSR